MRMKTVVAVLRGGPNVHYDASLESGAAVIAALDPERYDARDVFVTHDGFWHVGGMVMPPERALRGVDVVFNCIHGQYGEDGWLHQLIAKLGHKMVGSRSGSLALAHNKERSKLMAQQLGFMMPAHQMLSREANLDVVTLHLFRSFPMPAVVRSAQGSTPYGSSVATDLPMLRREIEVGLAQHPKILVEELIGGAPATVSVIEGLRREFPYMRVLGEMDVAEQRVLTDMAWRMHRQLGLLHHSASDFIVNNRGVWYVETRALPEFHAGSHFAATLQKSGVPMKEFVEHVVALAQK